MHSPNDRGGLRRTACQLARPVCGVHGTTNPGSLSFGLRQRNRATITFIFRPMATERCVGLRITWILMAGRTRTKGIHVRHSEEISGWVFVLSDISGQIPNSREYLGAGTVVMGALLGANNPQQRYLLGEKGDWGPTEAKLQVITWKSVKPPRFEIQTFIHAPEKVAMVTPVTVAPKR